MTRQSHRRGLVLGLLAAGSLLMPWSRARAEPPASTKPFPAIEAGMHTAIIRRIAVDRAGRWAVTASDDKTARIWNLASGQLERVLRVPVGEGAEGKLFAVALSPDGELVALGGYTSPDGSNTSIYLLDRASGRLRQRLTGLPNVVQSLAFSADGRRLAAGLGGGNGIRVYGATGQGAWAQVAADGEYGANSHSVEFDAAGRLLATSYDGELRLYGAGGSGRLQPLVRRAAPGGKQPFSARFSPDGRRIAVGFADSTAVAVLDGSSLEPLAPADTSSITNGTLSSVAWSADGRRLLTAGSYGQGDGSRPLVVWPAGGGAPQRLPLGINDTVMDLRPLPDGRLVYAGADPAWGVLDPQLRRSKVFAEPPVLDHRSDAASNDSHAGYKAFRQAPNGRWLEFRAVSRTAQGPTTRLVRFDLAQRRLLLPGAAAPGGLAPRSTGLPIEGWQNTTSPTLAGKPLPLERFEISRSLAISANGSTFALGADWAVRLFEADGRQRWRTSTPGAAWLVNLSADGRHVLAALADGSIRWYRSSDGTLALSLFVHPDGRWLLWTPEGFYEASPATATTSGGASLLGYQLNQGRNREATFVSAAQLGENFYRPDLVAARLQGNEAAIAAAVARVGDVRQLLRADALPPQVRILSQRPLPGGEVEITYELLDRGGGIGPVELRLDGAVISGRANPPVAGINRHVLPLPPKNKLKLSLTAYSRSLVGAPPAELSLAGSGREEPPTLHLLAVGITAYRDGALRNGVRFAASDARAFRDALLAAGRAPTSRVAEPVLLTDEQASAARIRQELAAIAGRVRPGDLFVLYLAGHGVSDDNGEYLFLPQDLVYRNSAALAEGGLGGSELRRLLAAIPSNKTVVVLDTCSSGAFSLSGRSLGEKGAIDRLARLSGRVVLAAAGDQRMALESPDNQRGIFTGSLVRALAGAADRNGDGQVGVREVADYVEQEVQRLTRQLFGYEQTPMSDLSGQNFPLSRSGGR